MFLLSDLKYCCESEENIFIFIVVKFNYFKMSRSIKSISLNTLVIADLCSNYVQWKYYVWLRSIKNQLYEGTLNLTLVILP